MSAGSPPVRGAVRVCPLFVGREADLASVLRRRDEAASGRGGMLLIGGEAGIGKSRLLDEVTLAAGGRVVHAESYARDRQTPGLLLLGIASGLREAGNGAAAGRLRSLVTGATADADAPATTGVGRRLLVADLVEALVEALRVPLLLRLEDLHWADQLSLDVVRRVSVRLPELPSLVVGTYRTHESDADPEFTAWRLDLVAHRHAEEHLLERLDREGTRRMLASIEGAEPSDDEVERMHAAADGIPLHVEELLAVGVGAVPETVGEAVLVRMRRLSPDSARVLSAAAVVGRRFDPQLLRVVLEGTGTRAGDPHWIDDALDDLIAQHFLVPSAGSFDFRHALIRDAVYSALPLADRRGMHARVADGAPTLPDAVLSLHSERAGRADEAYGLATRAAQRASALSAHREAVELFRRAERTVPSGTPPHERAELHRMLGAELAAADANSDAETEFARAVDLYREAGDALAAASVVPALVAARHLLGAGYDARARDLQRALEWIDGSPEGPRTSPGGPRAREVRGRILAALAAAAMLDRRLDESLAYADRARPLLADDPGERFAVDATRGSDLVFSGAGEAGWQLLQTTAEEAASARFEAQAARAYRMLGSSASVLLQYPRGERWLREGIDYSTRTERWNDAHYLMAHLAHVRWATGDLAGAEGLAAQALADGRGGITTEITALHVLGYVAVARGDAAAAERQLSRAAELGERMHELQRLSPALWGLAETALLTGDPARAAGFCDRGLEKSLRVADAAYLFPFAVTGTRALLDVAGPTAARDWLDPVAELVRRRGIPGTGTALTHAEGLIALRERRLSVAKSALAAAAEGWSGLGRWWEGTHAVLDQAEASRRTRSPGQAADLVARAGSAAAAAGATALVERADRLRARLSEGAEAGVLSAREQEVARLVATGATNRVIAETLHVAPKTVATHIEHILAKLGASRRAEIAAWAAARSRR